MSLAVSTSTSGTTCFSTSYCEQAESSCLSPQTVSPPDASIRVPECLCVSAVLETGGLVQDISSNCHRHRNTTVENADTFLCTQPDAFTRVFVKHATLHWLRIQNDSRSFVAPPRKFIQPCNPSSVEIGNTRHPSSRTSSPVAFLYDLASSIFMAQPSSSDCGAADTTAPRFPNEHTQNPPTEASS